MNLILDQGNTKLRLALFHQGEIQEQAVLPATDYAQFSDFWESLGWTYQHALFSGVGSSALFDEVMRCVPNLLQLKPDTPVPFISQYKTPNTWGMDRKALVMAAYKLYPESNVLVVDAGTCITYDFISAEGMYLGGGISPGLQMRLRAMQHFTARLPLVKPKLDAELIGQSTEESLQSGAVYGFKAEINGIIEAYKMRYPNLITLMTGGDLPYLAGMAKSGIFAAPDLILQGLNYIVEYNV